MRRAIRIERLRPRAGPREEPELTATGYKLGDPAHGKHKHHAEHAVYAATLEEAAALVAQGYSIWMGAKGKRASLIAPRSVRIVWADE